MRSRLFYRILLTWTVFLGVVLIILGILFFRFVKGELEEEIKVELTARSQVISLLPQEEIRKKLSSLAEMARSRVTLIDEQGWVIADSEKDIKELDNHLNRPEIQESRIRGKGDSIRYSHTLGVDMLYVAVPLREGEAIKGYLRLARPLFDVKRTLDKISTFLYESLLIVFFPALFVIFFLTGKFVDPLHRILSYLEKVSKGDIHGTLRVDTRDELARIADHINTIVMKYQEKIRSAFEEKEKLESAFASMVEGVLILDQEGRIEFVNKGLKDILGTPYGKDFVGMTPLEAFRSVELQDIIDRFGETKIPFTKQIVMGADNPVVMEVAICSLKDLSGKEGKIMLVFHDITRLTLLERIRTDFVANVTHEIKTPLTAIIGFVETLQQGPEENVAKKFLHIIHENALRLNRLVDDLLTLSSVELGDVKMNFEEVSLPDVLKSVQSMYESKIREKSLTVETTVPEDIPYIEADRDKITQVFLNILDNAIKFTPHGGMVRITVSRKSEDSVVVEFSDTGIGIPRSEIPRLGERFYRVDKMRSRELGGTGLGLSIVKHLMKAHKGYIKIESQLGKGTSVFLHFPIHQERADKRSDYSSV